MRATCSRCAQASTQVQARQPTPECYTVVDHLTVPFYRSPMDGAGSQVAGGHSSDESQSQRLLLHEHLPRP